MIFMVVWERGDRHTFNDEAQARRSMLAGDKLYSIDLASGQVKEIA